MKALRFISKLEQEIHFDEEKVSKTQKKKGWDTDSQSVSLVAGVEGGYPMVIV